MRLDDVDLDFGRPGVNSLDGPSTTYWDDRSTFILQSSTDIGHVVLVYHTRNHTLFISFLQMALKKKEGP